MPINYKTGIINEHKNVRNHSGIFDVSHMGQILIENNDKIKLGNTSTFRDYTFVQDLAKIVHMLILSKKNLLGQTINIGTNKTHKIIDIVKDKTGATIRS